MVRITEELVRKRAEHNESEIFSLEEITLHQENIEKIENLDKWCRELKILYLHSNLIPKIENVNRMKKLEYLNLTLNNILKIENLQGCESLEKLDLTVNFIAELTSVKNLKDNYNLKDLYLMGNPCAEYEGYREYVIATLPQLQSLDGREITKSERILALQNFSDVKQKIIKQQREKLNVSEESSEQESSEEDSGYSKEKEDRFWNRPSKFTPQSRIRVYKHIEKQKRKEEKRELDKKPKKRELRLFAQDGRPLCTNRANLDFKFTDDEDNNRYILDLAVYKYLDTSSIDVDVQPNYVRVIVKGKVFQLALQEEVLISSSTAQRSQTTGHMLITMPKAKEVIRPKRIKPLEDKKSNTQENPVKPRREYLEVTGSALNQIDKIASNNRKCYTPLVSYRKQPAERANSNDFIDDPEVPPLC